MDKDTRIFVRCTSDEKEGWHKTAAARETTLSDMVRRFLDRMAKKAEKQ